MNESPLPRKRGFNLLEMFSPSSKGDFREDDFRWIADWGFDFVRLPLCYLLWTDGHWSNVKEKWLAKIDRAVGFADKHGLHLCLNFHRAPGYCIAEEPMEPFNLWKDKEAEDAFCFHWELFARRYKGVDSTALSFNLVNEPHFPREDRMTLADHERVVRRAAAAIRAIDPNRLIVSDGVNVGTAPNLALLDLGIAQSCRAYAPMGLSHYGAEWTRSWLPAEKLRPPEWPGSVQSLRENKLWGRTELEAFFKPWVDLAGRGIGVHCGEGGAYNKTPHAVVLRWWEDVADILGRAGIGWALWNFRGPFGVLDSGRGDVPYVDWHGHALDAEFLRRLQAS